MNLLDFRFRPALLPDVFIFLMTDFVFIMTLAFLFSYSFLKYGTEETLHVSCFMFSFGRSGQFA